MLLGRLPSAAPKSKGRVISFASPDSDICLTTGSMRERVLGFLYLNGGPSVVRDIAAGIMSNPSRVTKSLKSLIDAGEVTAVKCEGCITEYSLTAHGTRICVNLDLKDSRG
jgi:predicted transcriptional regulator